MTVQVVHIGYVAQGRRGVAMDRTSPGREGEVEHTGVNITLEAMIWVETRGQGGGGHKRDRAGPSLKRRVESPGVSVHKGARRHWAMHGVGTRLGYC